MQKNYIYGEECNADVKTEVEPNNDTYTGIVPITYIIDIR